jgi:hypothetical protein
MMLMGPYDVSWWDGQVRWASWSATAGSRARPPRASASSAAPSRSSPTGTGRSPPASSQRPIGPHPFPHCPSPVMVHT